MPKMFRWTPPNMIAIQVCYTYCKWRMLWVRIRTGAYGPLLPQNWGVGTCMAVGIWLLCTRFTQTGWLPQLPGRATASLNMYYGISSACVDNKQMRLYGLLGGQVYIRVQSTWQTRGVRGHAPLGNFNFWPFIRRNLVKSGTVFAQTSFAIYCVIKAFIIDLHVN